MSASRRCSMLPLTRLTHSRSTCGTMVGVQTVQLASRVLHRLTGSATHMPQLSRLQACVQPVEQRGRLRNLPRYKGKIPACR